MTYVSCFAQVQSSEPADQQQQLATASSPADQLSDSASVTSSSTLDLTTGILANSHFILLVNSLKLMVALRGNFVISRKKNVVPQVTNNKQLEFFWLFHRFSLNSLKAI